MFKIKNSQEVEISISNTAQTSFYFGNEFIIRDARKITGIEVFSAADMTKTPTGATVISDANLKLGYLTLVTVDGNREVVAQMPLSSLQASNNEGIIREFDMPMINPSKCYVTFGDNAGLTANDVILFNFYYEA